MDFCRCCLIEEELYDSNYFEDEALADSFFKFSGLSESQRLPFDKEIKLCRNCAVQLENVVLFQTLCAKSNSILHKRYQSIEMNRNQLSPATSEDFLGFELPEKKPAQQRVKCYRSQGSQAKLRRSAKLAPYEVPLNDEPATDENFGLRRSRRLSRTEEPLKDVQTTNPVFQRRRSQRLSRSEEPTNGGNSRIEHTLNDGQPPNAFHLRRSRKLSRTEEPLKDEQTANPVFQRRRSQRLSRSEEPTKGGNSRTKQTLNDGQPPDAFHLRRSRKLSRTEEPLKDEQTTNPVFQRRRSQRLSRSEEPLHDQRPAKSARHLHNLLPIEEPLKDQPTANEDFKLRRSRRRSRTENPLDEC